MSDDEHNWEYVEIQADEAHEAEMRLSDIEARIKSLESRLESLVRKVYDIPPGVSIYFQDKDTQQERSAENILDEMDANISDFMDIVEAGEHD